MTTDRSFRRTKIVATLGPASASEQTVMALMEAGTNVFRINSSHGTPDERAEWMELIVSSRKRADRAVGLLVDLQGPRIRVGELVEPRELVSGQDVVFAHESDARGDELPTTYEYLADDVSAGDAILIDDGLLRVNVVAVEKRRVVGQVQFGGTLVSNKGINLPGVRVSAPAVTDKDREDIVLAVKHGADFVGLSFVSRAEDVVAARGLVPDRMRVVTKIELATAIRNLVNIVEASDAIMVARGDLGVELPFEEVPLAQKQVINLANRLGRPVITATQMLESMIEKPRPTRAEASDVANAVLDGTDAVMLSAETAIGLYPVATVEAMARIVEYVESSSGERRASQRRRSDRIFVGDMPTVPEAIASATGVVADMLGSALIVCLTSSGFTARQIAAARPTTPIVALTPERSTFHQLALTWGVIPIMAEHQPDYELMLDVARDHLTKHGYASPGDQVVVSAGVPFDVPGTTNLLKVEVV